MVECRVWLFLASTHLRVLIASPLIITSSWTCVFLIVCHKVNYPTFRWWRCFNQTKQPEKQYIACSAPEPMKRATMLEYKHWGRTFSSPQTSRNQTQAWDSNQTACIYKKNSESLHPAKKTGNVVHRSALTLRAPPFVLHHWKSLRAPAASVRLLCSGC
jgi:hypothetical protein